MHPNNVFRQTAQNDALALARRLGFGMLVTPSAGLVGSHVPFVLNEVGDTAELHLVRSNPIARHLKSAGDNAEALLAIQGPHAYISPDWYSVEDQVPTWNYVAVHLKGQLEALKQDQLATSLGALSKHFEDQLKDATGKQPWIMEKIDAQALSTMIKAIRPFRFHVQDVDSTFKLNQNKPPEAIAGASHGLETSPLGSEIDQLRQLMTESIQPQGN